MYTRLLKNEVIGLEEPAAKSVRINTMYGMYYHEEILFRHVASFSQGGFFVSQYRL